MAQTVRQVYEARVARGDLLRDAAQDRVIAALDDLGARLAASSRGRGGLFGWFAGKPEPVKGLYVWGGVGRGKTVLMDLFYETAPKGLNRRRSHFHEFMAEVHDRIGAARARSPGDPMPIVASEIAERAQLLCFDELHVTDIADAMILGRLFDHLFTAGVVVVATSNVPPQRLYENGLNRDLFLPFVRLIEQRHEVIELVSETDHRLRKLAGHTLYFTPLGEKAQAGMDTLWAEIAGPQPHGDAALDVGNRRVNVPRSGNGAARFDFHDLCDVALGPRDYLALARAYHTVFIDRIPVMSRAERNAARRFINLIDTLYDSRVCLVASAEAEPDALYVEGDGVELFARTASRLIEMRSEAYVADRLARLGAPEAAAATSI